MNLEAVRKLKPFDRLLYWVNEREAVRLKKEAGEPAPWTDDEILRTYRFCNVRRMDDKVSRWLMDNWYVPHKDAPGMLLAVAVARFFNLPSSLEYVARHLLWTSYYKNGQPHWEAVKNILRQRKAYGPIFNGAYMVRGNDGVDKVECVIDHYVRPLIKIKVNTDSMEAAWETICESYGMGSFMAGQIVADLRWAVTGKWQDRNHWAPAGPGSLRGLNRLHGKDPKDPWGRKNWTTQFSCMMAECGGRLRCDVADRIEAHDYQNVLCEYDKYCRVLFGEGKPKQLYRGGSGD